MTRIPPRTETVPPREFGAFLAKATEFAETARDALQDRKLHSAGLEAIHAVISAVDALTVARLGLRSKGEDHREVLHLIDQIQEEEIKELKRQVAEVLSVKNLVEYGGSGLSPGRTERTVLQAQRVVAWVAAKTKG